MPRPLRQDLRRIAESLLKSAGPVITLDDIGNALGTMAITSDEIDALISVLESAGRRVEEAEHAGGVERLNVVLTTARALRFELGRTPTAKEIADRGSLSLDAVQHALALARVIQR